MWYNWGVRLPVELLGTFRPRPTAADKYAVGTVAVIGGSSRFPHAPVFAGLGARAAGAGLIRLAVPDASRAAAAVHVPEATFADPDLTAASKHADVTVIGMGLGMGAETVARVDRLLAGASGRFVLDADALTALACRGASTSNGFVPRPDQELVLTPHEGEAARLLGVPREAIAADRPAAVRRLVARYRATVVLKGARSLVLSADGKRFFENPTGNPYMAMGGMGDLLAGVIAARWAALKGDPFVASASAVWLHGAAGDRLIESGGDPSIATIAAVLGAMRVQLERANTM